MPDGLAPNAVRITLAVEQVMEKPRYMRAALAWIAHVRPRWAVADDDGLALHFQLFARDQHYWQKLCVLFHTLGMNG